MWGMDRRTDILEVVRHRDEGTDRTSIIPYLRGVEGFFMF